MAGPALGYVVKRFGDFIVEETLFLRDVQNEADRLREELGSMECFLEDADARRKRDKRVKKWVEDVRKAAYQAEDLVESFALEAERSRRLRRGFIRKSIFCARLPSQLLSCHNFGREIELLVAKINDIKERCSKYGIADLGANEGGRSDVDEQVARRRRVLLHASDHDVVGMEDEKKAIVSQLLCERVKRRAVVSIVGMGGLGKTTLAKKVYNDPGIKRRFDLAVWIDVPQQYSGDGLLKELALQVLEIKSKELGLKLQELGKTSTRELECDGLLKELALQVSSRRREELGKMSTRELEPLLYLSLLQVKYLIVMDDVWDDEVWRIVEPNLSDERNGSRVLITTRSAQVARAADPSTPPHGLRFLDENESWELFLKKAFPEEEEEDGRRACPVELEKIGRQMVGKCGGLPLALTVLGGLLSQKRESIVEWYRVARTMIWQEEDEGQRCMKILRLSYTDLPQHLKWCFLYLGAFPEDMVIEGEKLIRLWIAEGFVANMASRTLEESAERYLEELVQRCLVQVAERSDFGVEKCRIHDLLHELSIAEAQELNFLICQKKGYQPDLPYSTLRRLSLHSAPEEFMSRSQSTPTPSLRTLLGFRFKKSSLGFPAGGLQLIRVIDLEGASIEVVPKQIGDLANLRYLGLRKTKIKSLPASVQRLSRLQFLDLRWTRIAKMTSAVWRIEALHQVFIPARVELRGIHRGSLRALHVLEKAKAGDWINSCLSKLTNLRTLRLTGIHGAHHRALSTALPELSHLAVLELDGKSIPESLLTLSCLHDLRSLALFGQIGQFPRPPQTLSYQWPRTLSTLILWCTGLVQDPLPSLGLLHNLRTLLLLMNSYLGQETTCPRDTFPKLRTLSVEYLEHLKGWTLEEGSMPQLKNLTISGCRELKMLPQGLEGLASLEELTLLNMSDALKARLEKERGDDWDKIRHIPSIIIDHRRITSTSNSPRSTIKSPPYPNTFIA